MSLLKSIKSFLSKRTKTAPRTEKRKYVRFRPSKDYPIHAELAVKDLQLGQKVVLDFNMEAIAIKIQEEELGHFSPKQRVPFALVIEGKRIPYEGEVLRTAPGRLVIKYVDQTKQKSEILSDCSMKILGSTIKPMSLGLEKPKKAPYLWLHGDYNTDLFAWKEEGERPVKLIFVFADNVIEYEISFGIRTGIIKRKQYADSFDFAKREESPRQYDENPKPLTVKLAKIALEKADIETSLKDPILGLFTL